MDGREAIIADILEKANAAAAGLIADAQADKAETLEKARAEAMRKRDEALTKAHADADVLRARRKTLSGLEARKIELAAKQQAVEAAFDEARKKIGYMTDHIYREFIGSFITEYADDGDSVCIAACDEKRLSNEWLQTLSKKCGKTLTLAPEKHSASGGVILRGKT